MNTFNLSKQWFRFCYEQPEARPHHTSLYFWIIDRANRSGWKDLIDIPTDFTMQSTGIGSYATYRRCLTQLEEWGLIQWVVRAKNQHYCNKIRLLDGSHSPAINGEATAEAAEKQPQKQGKSTDGIYKPIQTHTNPKTHTNPQNGPAAPAWDRAEGSFAFGENEKSTTAAEAPHTPLPDTETAAGAAEREARGPAPEQQPKMAAKAEAIDTEEIKDTAAAGKAKKGAAKQREQVRESAAAQVKAQKGRKAASATSAHVEVSLPFEGKPFRRAWQQWLTYRRSRRLACNPTYQQGMLQHLAEISDNDGQDAIAIIRQSIVQGWSGLFHLRGQHRHTQQQQKSCGSTSASYANTSSSTYNNVKKQHHAKYSKTRAYHAALEVCGLS